MFSLPKLYKIDTTGKTRVWFIKCIGAAIESITEK